MQDGEEGKQPKKKRTNRSAAQVSADRMAIARLALKEYTQLEIANMLEISQSTVSRELQKLREDWKAAAVRDISLERGRVVTKIRMVQHEAWNSWQLSLQSQKSTLYEVAGSDAVSRFMDSQGADEGEEVEEGDRAPIGRQKYRQTEKQPTGNPSYLRVLLEAIRDESRLLDLYPKENAPVRDDLKFEDLLGLDFSEMSTDALTAIANGNLEPLEAIAR